MDYLAKFESEAGPLARVGHQRHPGLVPKLREFVHSQTATLEVPPGTTEGDLDALAADWTEQTLNAWQCDDCSERQAVGSVAISLIAAIVTQLIIAVIKEKLAG